MTNSDIEACKWLALSLNNLQRALYMEKTEDLPSSMFYFQQALEFFIKSIIVFIGGEPKRCHDPGQQLQAVLGNKDTPDEVQTLLDLSAELSQEYLNARYPGDDLPWEIYDQESVKITKQKVITAFGTIKILLQQLLPDRTIEIEKCLRKSIKNPKLKAISEEMIHYLE